MIKKTLFMLSCLSAYSAYSAQRSQQRAGCGLFSAIAHAFTPPSITASLHDRTLSITLRPDNSHIRLHHVTQKAQDLYAIPVYLDKTTTIIIPFDEQNLLYLCVHRCMSYSIPGTDNEVDIQLVFDDHLTLSELHGCMHSQT